MGTTETPRARTATPPILVRVDPQLATEWLAKQNRNRKVSRADVDKYAKDMAAGRWVAIPGENTIKFADDNGELVNGQHRLMAIMESQTVIELWVDFSFPRHLVPLIDNGRRRSASDVLSMNGISNSTNIAAAASLVLRYERHKNNVWSGFRFQPTKAEVEDEVFTHQGNYIAGLHLADQLRPISKGKHITRTPYTSLCVLVDRHSPNAELLSEFHYGLRTGANLEEGDPRLALRTANVNKVWGGSQVHLFGCLKAWNAWIEGAEMRMLKTGSPKYLPMPEVK